MCLCMHIYTSIQTSTCVNLNRKCRHTIQFICVCLCACVCVCVCLYACIAHVITLSNLNANSLLVQICVYLLVHTHKNSNWVDQWMKVSVDWCCVFCIFVSGGKDLETISAFHVESHLCLEIHCFSKTNYNLDKKNGGSSDILL